MNQDFCKHLRSKSMFTLTDPQQAFVEREDGTCGCNAWCNRTQTVTGPDDRPVNTDTCKPGRSCYEN